MLMAWTRWSATIECGKYRMSLLRCRETHKIFTCHFEDDSMSLSLLGLGRRFTYIVCVHESQWLCCGQIIHTDAPRSPIGLLSLYFSSLLWLSLSYPPARPLLRVTCVCVAHTNKCEMSMDIYSSTESYLWRHPASNWIMAYYNTKTLCVYMLCSSLYARFSCTTLRVH